MRLPSKTVVFWILMAASGVSAFLLDASCTARGRGFFQPLVLLQWPASQGARETSQALVNAGSEPITAERARSLLKENEHLQLQVAQQRKRVAVLERRLDELSGLRGQLPDSHVRIVIAPVVSYDANPRCTTLQIALTDRQRRLVQEGQWVAAASAPRPGWDPEATLRDLVDREWLIGRVSEVQTRVARVQLATDRRFRNEVRTARVLDDGTWQFAQEGCLLTGQGRGRMRISQAVRDYFKTGYRIVVVPTSRELPAPLSIGRIEDSTPHKDSSQHFDLVVVPWERVERLTHVYVIAREP